jgi:diaminopimelate epimerase
MPPVQNVEKRHFALDGENYEATLVNMDGISHIILETSKISGVNAANCHAFAEKAVRVWNDELGRDALGIMLLRKEGDAHRIEPLVFVPGSGSLVWERGCGSGTAAMGASFAWQAKAPVERSVLQPGGRIKVKAGFEAGAVGSIVITGRTSLAARGVAYI